MASVYDPKQAEPDLPYLRKVVGASMAGTVVEWYEFFLYATVATLVFGKLFFPATGNELDGIIAAFATYAVGFLARPLGGIVFGHVGDRIGRKALLQLSLVLVGVSTFLMGCLPTFETIGYAAPILLVILRFVQGFAVGGEWGGAVLLVTEHSPDRRRAFWGSWPQAAVPMGNLLATAVLLILSAMLSEEQFLAWGWRVGFWLSVVIVGIGYYIRTQIADSPIFQAHREELAEAKAAKFGPAEVLRRYPRKVLNAMGLRFGENIVYYMIVTFSITYLNHIGVDTGRILALLFIGHLVHAAIIPVVGSAADVVGRRGVYITGALLTMAWPFLAFPLFDSELPSLILGAIVFGLVFHAMMYAPQPAIMTEMFPTRMRYSGVSLGYQVTALFAGSWAPLIGAWLLREYNDWTPIAVYICAAAAVSLVSALVLKETRGVSLYALDEADRQRGAV